VLTNQRLILLSQMRPIDKLFGILDMIASSQQDQPRVYDDFMDFASAYSAEETCAMLVQIVAESKAQYQVSERTDHLMQLKRTITNREARLPPHAGLGGRQHMRGAGSSSLTRRQFGGPFQATQLSNQRSIFVGRPSSLKPVEKSHSLPRGG